MISDVLVVNVRMLIVMRLLIATVISCLGFWTFPDLRELFALLVIFLCLLSLVYIFWFLPQKRFLGLGYTQIILDLIWETVLVHFTGGVDSVFVVFYVITILAASLVLPAMGGVWTGIWASLIFTLTVSFEFLPLHIPELHIYIKPYYRVSDWFLIAYLTLVRITIFGIVGYLGTYFVNRIYNLEKKLKNQEQLTNLGELTAMIAHEIKNPLMAISGTIEVLHKELEPQLSGENKDLMTNVLKETQRLKNILTSMLDYSRIDSVRRERFDLKQALDEVVAVMENSPQKNGKVRVVKIFEKKPIRFYGDSNRIKQMMYNLMLNAYEAMPGGGDLVVSLKQERNDHVVISVMDTGKGVSTEMQKLLFQPFQSTKQGGTGLGLVIVQKIVKSHGGKISIRNMDGLGAEFIVDLPCVTK